MIDFSFALFTCIHLHEAAKVLRRWKTSNVSSTTSVEPKQRRYVRVEKKKRRANFFFLQFPIQLKFLHFCPSSVSLVFPSHHLSPVSVFAATALGGGDGRELSGERARVNTISQWKHFCFGESIVADLWPKGRCCPCHVWKGAQFDAKQKIFSNVWKASEFGLSRTGVVFERNFQTF